MYKKIIIVALIIISSDIEAKRMKLKEVEKILEQPTTISSLPSISPAEQEAIKKRLDEQLRAPIESAWDDRVDDLFKLATINPELARFYFKKMSEKMTVTDVKPIEVVEQKPEIKPIEKPAEKEEQKVIEPEKSQEPQKTEEKTVPEKVMQEKVTAEEKKPAVEEKPTETTLPAGEEPMKKATGIKAPPRKIVPKPTEVKPSGETAVQVPSGEEPMKTSTRPAPPKKGAPSGGPKKTLAPAKATPKAATEAKTTKPAVTLKGDESFGLEQLKRMEPDQLLVLFNEYIDKLPRYWVSTATEKIEKIGGHGGKTTIVLRGAPNERWKNNMQTIQRALVFKGEMSEPQVAEIITKRIAQVREEQAAKPVISAQPEEKPQEELTEDDLVKLIEGLLAEAEQKKGQIGWVVSIKGNIKALDKINHEQALKYQEEFIKWVPKEKTFLK